MCVSPFRSHGFTLSVAVSAHLRFAIPAVKHSMGHTFDYTVTLFSPLVSPISELYLLRLLLTSHSSLLLQQMRPSVRPHGISKPASLSSSTCLIYIHGLRLPFGLRCPKPAYPPCMPCIRFLSVKLRFRYPFLSPTPHDINLGSCFGVRRQLRPLWTFTTD